jgi:hypothetical protein
MKSMATRLTQSSLVAVLIVGLMAGSVFAAKPAGAGGGKPGGGGGGTSSLSVVLVNSTDGYAHYSQQVDFVVSTTATDKPYVRLNCYENGVWVMTDSTGYYPSYPWPGHIFTLRWDAYHTAGAGADCTATLYYYASKGTVSLTSLNFHVYP